MEKNKSSSVYATLLCLAVLGVVAGGADDSLVGKCSSQFQKVTQCLPFVRAKVPTPTKDCCASVTDLKETDPACLCFIIQQIHNGSNAAVRSMGLQEARLLHLPSACKLANASVSDCPSLLHLPPNSPDAAIFTNASSATTTTPVATPEGGSSSSSTTPSSGAWHKPRLGECGLSVAMTLGIFFLPCIPNVFMHGDI